MRRIVVLMLLAPVMLSAAIEGRFMQNPDIRGDKIVFTYENDLWLVSAQGGLASRLTSHPGNENAAKFSPDGKWIAFSGNYDQGNSVYLIPADGGVPRRLTWQHSDARVVTWTPDGKKVVYRSGFENLYRPIVKLFAVATDGAWPEKLPVPRGVLASYSPDGGKLAYCPRGNEEYYWKRYKGGQYQDIWMYDFTAKSYTKLTDYVGKNSYPMWIGNKLYFTSDRTNGIANIYTYDFATKKVEQITRFDDFDVQMASSDGQQIVYFRSGYLYVLDTHNNSIRKVEVQIPSDRWQLADRTINVKEYIHSMAISNDGKTAVFEARGDVFLVPADENQPTVNLTHTSGARERYPQLSPDGQWIAFFSDKSGEYQLYLMSRENPGAEWVQLTTSLKSTLYRLQWSPDSKKILFSDKSFTLYYVDVATKKLVKIDSSTMLKNDEFIWEMDDYTWSPDSRWVAYSYVQENRNSVIYLYNLEQGKSYTLTTDFYDNLNPAFDASGDYLYYISYRNWDVQMDVFEDDHIIAKPTQIMAVQLKAGQAPPFEKKAKDDKDKKSGAEPFRIDLDGIQNRTFPLPVESGNFFYAKAGKGKISWASVDEFGEDEYEEIYRPKGASKWKLHIYDMDDQQEAVFEDNIADWSVSSNGEQILIKKKDDYYAGTLDKAFSAKKPGDKLNLDRMFSQIKVVEEWNQIFSDTWRWYRDFFYDANMHGRDWKKMGEAYRAYVPQLNSRNELNWVLSQMVGELCVSHTYVGGGDNGPVKMPENPVFTGLLGVDLAPGENGFYRLEKIYGPTDFNRDLVGPLVRPDAPVKEGDYLIAIDGVEVKYPVNPYQLLQVTKDQKVKITINDKPVAAGGKTFITLPARNEYQLRYNRWVADNIAQVLKASNGDIGYLHLTAMGGGNTGQFDKFWRAFRYKKGLIIDVRGNGGGWTEYFIIDKLERKQTSYNVMQNMQAYRYPNSSSHAHFAVLTNEYNGSDGEAFVEDFKANNLGTVIGVPSWGGLVGIINAQTTIDNGSVNQSNNAFWGKEGKWLVENHGADPDILVENDPASAMAGQDKQLQTAIDTLMKQIAEKPWTFPERPAYPKK